MLSVKSVGDFSYLWLLRIIYNHINYVHPYPKGMSIIINQLAHIRFSLFNKGKHLPIIWRFLVSKNMGSR